MRVTSPSRVALLSALVALFVASLGGAAFGADVFVRVRVVEPTGETFRLVVGGFRHADPWYFPERAAEVPGGGAWGAWVDLSDWPWHGRLDRQGGVAEWPSVKLTLRPGAEGGAEVKGCALEVQIADRPDEAAVVHAFTERGAADAVGFLLPHPLREHAKEFETGSQMATRQREWATAATGGKPVELKRFEFITSLWGHYDPALALHSIGTLRQLGFNVIGNAPAPALREAGMLTYHAAWIYHADPRQAEKEWAATANSIQEALQTDDGKWAYGNATHWVLADEVTTLDLRPVPADERDGWFREHLRARGVTDADLGQPVAQARYPADAMHAKTLPRDADLPARRLLYHAAKFGQWWSAKRLRHGSDLIRATFPGAKTETLPADHGFFGAWGPPHLGMGYRMLDLFELGDQQAVDQMSSEDWLGLNHMYGPGFTWTGAQSFEYFNALCRSAIDGTPATLRALVTPSDDGYLRLKTYSALGQGTKSFFFWTFGPTYIGTENYWSDLRSQYDGLAKLGRALQQAEDVLHPAEPVRDPVAVLYSVSHDHWHNDNPAAFVEKRLLWHALRHVGVQPDFLREEDVEAGRLKDYKVLYVTDWCVARKASAAIDAWVKGGGVVHLSCGAATRDEFYEPHVPPFAATVWPDDAAARMKVETGHAYNERNDLPGIQPMARATVQAGEAPWDAPVVGCRLSLREVDGASRRATFADDNAPAGASVRHGDGTVFGWGFLPMLAYGQSAGFKPTTLEETWPAAGARALVRLPLDAAKVVPAARADVPVVEASLLDGERGAALVLVNYTYKPIDALAVDVRLPWAPATATSTDGKPVRVEKTADGVRLHLPLEWTDIVLLPR